MSDFAKIEHILEENGVFVGTTSGVSMYPMLRNRRDTIVIRPVTGRLQKYDVPLYRRGTQYVLHRIVEVRPQEYVIIGDNCIKKEYVKEEQVLGVLTEFYRGEKHVDMSSWKYRVYVRIWCALYPIRVLYKKGRRFLSKMLKRR